MIIQFRAESSNEEGELILVPLEQCLLSIQQPIAVVTVALINGQLGWVMNFKNPENVGVALHQLATYADATFFSFLPCQNAEELYTPKRPVYGT